MKILVWILGYCIIYLFIFWLNYCIIWKKKKKNCSVHCATRRPSILLELRPYEEVVYLIFKVLSFILIFRINNKNLLIKWIYICVCKQSHDSISKTINLLPGNNMPRKHMRHYATISHKKQLIYSIFKTSKQNSWQIV